jgi:uncharacterized protein with gpF-like domain
MFQARRTREKRVRTPVGVGKPLTPSAALRSWYERQMMSVVNPMIEDYQKTLRAAFEEPEVKITFAMDDVLSIFQRTLRALNKKWADIFQGFASQLAPEFVSKADTQNKSATWFSLSAAGVEQPRQQYNESVARTLETSVTFNHTLITNIQQEVHEELHNAVMLFLTSPNPEEQGMSGIANALRRVGITSRNRVDLIARDQNSKLNSSLSTERMRQNGADWYTWLHSSAGKEPRECHQDMDGGIFKIDDERVWHVGTIHFDLVGGGKGSATLKKGDVGPPGWAINCRCRMKPMIGYMEDED